MCRNVFLVGHQCHWANHVQSTVDHTALYQYLPCNRRHIAAVLWSIASLLISVAIYYPFFKISERSLTEEEKALPTQLPRRGELNAYDWLVVRCFVWQRK